MIYSFISYSSKDVTFAEKLETDLNKDAIQTWRDRSRLLGDHHWDDEIEKVLSDPSLTHVVILLSPNSLNSEMVKNEIEYGRLEGKSLVVAKLADCKLPLILVRKNFIDFTKEYDQGYQLLLKTLQAYAPPTNIAPIVSTTITSTLKLTDQQIKAAHDSNHLIRLVASPGTGKSLVIEERVRWLLESGVTAKSIQVVSFTRAASNDLKKRIINYCSKYGLNQAKDISVTTLHSLALRTLKMSRQLYTNPHVLDEWELKNIFDLEFSSTVRNTSPALSNLTPSRAEDVRDAWEAYWNTGKWDAPQYLPPKIPVTDAEKDAFNKFHKSATSVYSCVLPGEIVKMCVDRIEAGTLNPLIYLGTLHLIIDEFQDLNYIDQQFVDNFIRQGVSTFVAGDDDQSIYSFRYAYPNGIQEFSEKYKPINKVSEHTLTECFRCTPDILDSVQKLIEDYQSPQRIDKTSYSFCKSYSPTLNGVVHRWIFKSGKAEIEGIANSCKALIDKGIKPRNILILISNRNILLPGLQEAFAKINVPITVTKGDRYIDSESGRLAYALIRIACDLDLEDYVAHRTILGLFKGIGIQTINKIREKVILNSLNYLDLFYNSLPSGVFDAREIKAVTLVKDVCKQLHDWKSEDKKVDRVNDINGLIEKILGDVEAQEWLEYIKNLPDEMNLGELLTYLSTDNSDQQETILEDVYNRLGLQIPAEGLLPQQVSLMTMHGAKGLNADVVFILGLEQGIIPNVKHFGHTGKIQESARQLYVSMTRARVACIVSYSTSRNIQGNHDWRTASEFTLCLNGKFKQCSGGLNNTEVDAIVEANLLYEAHMNTRLGQL